MKNFSQVYIKPDISKSSNPKIGVITLSTDFTIEQDFRRICYGQNVDIYVNRIPFKNPLNHENYLCLLYTSPSPRDLSTSRMPSSA